MDRITERISKELNKPAQMVQKVIDLLDEGNTVPFIARYRKEAHGAMDDTALRTLEERLRYLRSLEQRREEIRRLIDEQEKLTPELSGEIDRAETLSALEDIYRPYRPKRRTRASIAKEKGLEPLTAANPVSVNQVGYRPNDPKSVFVDEAADKILENCGT